MLGQHLDELHADDDGQRVGEKFLHIVAVALHKQFRQPAQQRDGGDDQPYQHHQRDQHLDDAGSLRDLVTEHVLEMFLVAVEFSSVNFRETGKLGGGVFRHGAALLWWVNQILFSSL